MIHWEQKANDSLCFCIHGTTHTEGDQYGNYCQFAMAAYNMAVAGCMAYEEMEIKPGG